MSRGRGLNPSRRGLKRKLHKDTIFASIIQLWSPTGGGGGDISVLLLSMEVLYSLLPSDITNLLIIISVRKLQRGGLHSSAHKSAVARLINKTFKSAQEQKKCNNYLRPSERGTGGYNYSLQENLRSIYTYTCIYNLYIYIYCCSARDECI